MLLAVIMARKNQIITQINNNTSTSAQRTFNHLPSLTAQTCPNHDFVTPSRLSDRFQWHCLIHYYEAFL